MTDARTYPANERVADASLTPFPTGCAPVKPETLSVATTLTDLCRAPDGTRDRQLLWGDQVSVYENRNGWSFVRAKKDGYVGYVATQALSEAADATHRVSGQATHLYPAADFKTSERCILSYGSRLHVIATTNGFAQTPDGYVPGVHLSPIHELETDPVDVALGFLGTPYLWGGNSIAGLDCSGLVQVALLACGIACPGDSDQQQRAFENEVAPDSIQRGDLLFWKGHVAIATGAEEIVHANAHHMAVSLETIKGACARIDAQGDGPLLAIRRP